MASKTNMSTANQGPRLGGGFKGKVAANPMKPKLKAKIKNAQSLGGGLKQGKGGAKYVSKNSAGKGVKQAGTTARKPAATRVGTNKLNKAPISAQPKYAKSNPKQPKNNFTLHNSVTPADVARLRKASNLATPKMGGGGFKSYIGAK